MFPKPATLRKTDKYVSTHALTQEWEYKSQLFAVSRDWAETLALTF